MKWLTVTQVLRWHDRLCVELAGGQWVYVRKFWREVPTLAAGSQRLVMRHDQLSWNGKIAQWLPSGYSTSRNLDLIWGKKGARAMALLVLLLMQGCAEYNKTGWWTPDTFTYTYADTFKNTPGVPPTHYLGLGWTIKK